MMTEEDEAFNEIERRSKVKQTLVKAQLGKPKREWVGLTHDERLEILANAVHHKWDDYKIVKDIEAKLKEKNT
jgi:hypothetical protein